MLRLDFFLVIFFSNYLLVDFEEDRISVDKFINRGGFILVVVHGHVFKDFSLLLHHAVIHY